MYVEGLRYHALRNKDTTYAKISHPPETKKPVSPLPEVPEANGVPVAGKIPCGSGLMYPSSSPDT